MHLTDDITTRGGLMVALETARFAAWKCALVADRDGTVKACREFDAIRTLSASDAALARAIDRV